jgi:hypothetical protein
VRQFRAQLNEDDKLLDLDDNPFHCKNLPLELQPDGEQLPEWVRGKDALQFSPGEISRDTSC